MKNHLLFLSFAFFTGAAGPPVGETYRYVPNNCFYPGESVQYRVHYGFFTAAEGTVTLYNDLYKINNRVCYRVDVFGNSIGLFDMVMRIRDNWGTYIDTAAIIPHKFYRNIEEGRYRKYEFTDFDHSKDTATVTTLNKQTREVETVEKFLTPDNVQDIVSGYYYLRLMDLSKYRKGDTLSIGAFFDDESYDFKLKYLGKETIKTKLGRNKSFVFQPIMPENSLFEGNDAIKFWISDDLKKIPLKIEAQMFVGAVEVDIADYQPGVRRSY